MASQNGVCKPTAGYAHTGFSSHRHVITSMRAFRLNPPRVRRFYNQIGYCILANVFDDVERKRLIRSARDILGRQPLDGKYMPSMNPHRESAGFARALRHPDVVRIAEDLLQSQVEAVQTMFYWKPPGALGVDLHQDNAFVHTYRDALVSAWWSIDDSDSSNGGIVVFPQSHVEPILPVRRVPIPFSNFPSFPNARGRETIVHPRYRPLSLHVPHGAVAFIHGHLVHGSYDNMSSRFRRAFLVDYVSKGATFSVGRYANRSRIPIHTKQDRSIDT